MSLHRPLPARLLSVSLLVVLLAGLLLAVPWSGTADAWIVLDPPVTGPVLDGFDAPTRYGAGHRGVDLGADEGTPVRASAAGRVSFAGHVVGRLWVTVDHGTVRTTVGPLATARVAAGDRVWRGSVLGTSGRAHGRPGVHWSVRRGDTYLDPTRVGRVVATLVPSGARTVGATTVAARPVPTGQEAAPASLGWRWWSTPLPSGVR